MLFSNESSVTISNSTISNNSATGDGGGIYQGLGDISIESTQLTQNSASIGGGIYNSRSVNITNSNIDQNIGVNTGGGIYASNSLAAVNIDGGTISENSTDVNGGGIYVLLGSFNAFDLIISGNSAAGTGAGYFNNSGTGNLVNTIISGNKSTNEGGGVRSAAGQVDFLNCTVTGNMASIGGGLFLQNSAITNLANSIIAKNSSTVFDSDISNSGIMNNLGGNFIGDNSTVQTEFPADGLLIGTTANPVDPQFVIDVPAAPSTGGDLHLLCASAAIDAGDNGAVGLPGNDIEGNARIQFAIVDIGAYESQVESCSGLCNSYGNNSNNYWIKRVKFSNFNNQTGDDGGYGDYTSLTAEVEQDEDYDIKLKPGFNGKKKNVYWRVWIDWNQDGDFEDNGEKVVQKKSKNQVKKEIEIPEDALTGTTIMRVSMNRNGYVGPCDIVPNGEVEDYTILVLPEEDNDDDDDDFWNPCNSCIKSKVISEESQLESIKIFPNPASDFLKIQYSGITKENSRLAIYNTVGAIMYSAEVDSKNKLKRLNLDGYENGVYFFEIKSEKGSEIHQFVVIK